MGLFDVVDGFLGTDLTGKKGSAAALQAQTQATDKANEVQKYMFDTQRSDLAPWRAAGQNALSSLTDPNFGKNLEMDPGYRFRMQEGEKAINAGAAARGLGNSGATLKALTKYGQDFASNEYNNAYNRQYNRLSQLAGFGTGAVQQGNQAAQNYGNNVAANYIGMGNAQGAAHMAASNSQNQLLGQAVTGAALAFSDARLKTNIERLERSAYKDVPTYQFEYKNKKYGDGTHVGVLAQDLLKLNRQHPAVIKDKATGYYKVDYSKLEVI